MSKVRIAVVNSHPIQYFAPLYAFLNRDSRLDVTALYCSDIGMRGSVDPSFNRQLKWDIDVLAGYRYVFLDKRVSTRTPAGFWSLVVPRIWSEVRSGKYDVLWLHGYAYAVDLIAFLAAKSKGLPVFLRGETHLGLGRPGWRRWLHKLVLSRAFKLIDGFLAIGKANADYYRAMGVPERKIFCVPYTVDNDRFIDASSLTAQQRDEVRRDLGLPMDKPVILYAAKFMRRKRPSDLLHAAATLLERGHEFSLLMVGSGEMDAELRQLVAQLKLPNVVFTGFVNQAELPRLYSASDVFVLPSENEPWGLIVNEVMCAGLPVVVCKDVGCVPDLVKEGVNGYRIVAGEPRSLAEALAKVLHDPARRAAMGRESLAIMRGWSYENCRAGVLDAVRAVLPHRVANEKKEVLAR